MQFFDTSWHLRVVRTGGGQAYTSKSDHDSYQLHARVRFGNYSSTAPNVVVIVQRFAICGLDSSWTTGKFNGHRSSAIRIFEYSHRSLLRGTSQYIELLFFSGNGGPWLRRCNFSPNNLDSHNQRNEL